ncbi:MAG TPA: hypothetical protein VGM05_00155 [Planctomycetaceae bacterium]|jgi:hypothetical protein
MFAIRTAFFLLLLIGIGCGGGPPTGDVEGTVTFEGAPIEQGSITFLPEDGKGPSAGGTISAGRYRAPKVPVGTAKVSITGAKSIEKKRMYNDPNAPLVQTSVEMLPEKYHKTTTLRYDVVPGEQTKDFHLEK